MKCIEKHYGKEVHFNEFEDLLNYIDDINVKKTVKTRGEKPVLFKVIGYYVKESHEGHIYSVHAIQSEGNDYSLWVPAYGTVE
ncbi:hypothetical protein P4607_12095 [Priestia megaterium]|uniref:hypothetical protein n=1 Tax=Priestia megaterium TaxID=1404 RepID=UPI002E1AC648|nr:hypothetical protein [Priestia megaterium]